MVARLGFALDASGADRFDRRFEQTARKAERTTAATLGTIAGFAGAIGSRIAASMLAVGEAVLSLPMNVVKAGDAMQQQINSLTGILESADQATGAYERLYQGIRTTGGQLDKTVEAFGNYDLALKKNGKTTDEVVDFVLDLGAAMAAYGVKGAQAASVTLQLGQALGKGKLGDDELVSLREAMPKLVDEIRKGLDMTDEAFAKAAEKGELTTAKVLPVISRFTAEARKRMADLPLTFAIATQNLKTTWDRFLGDIDRAFGFSSRLATAVQSVADRLEEWRKKLPIVREWIAALGDLNSILYTVTAALIAVAGVKIGGLALAFGLLAAKVALIVAGLLIVEDIIGWMMGKESVTGDLFGEFGDVKAKILGQFEEMKAGVVEFWNTALSPESRATLDALGAAFTGFFDIVIEGWKNILGGAMANWRELMAFGNWLDDLFLKLIRFVRDDLVGAFNTVTTAIGGMFSAAQKAFNFIIDAIGRLGAGNTGTTGALGDPGGSGFQLQNFGVPQVNPGAAIAPAAAVNAPQNNSIQNNVTVNATGSSGAEVASGARQGVAAAARDMISDLGGVARNLAMAMPRAETAAA